MLPQEAELEAIDDESGRRYSGRPFLLHNAVTLARKLRPDRNIVGAASHGLATDNASRNGPEADDYLSGGSGHESASGTHRA